jgi:hypothetical protein
LPFGYTFTPSPFVDVYGLKGMMRPNQKKKEITDGQSEADNVAATSKAQNLKRSLARGSKMAGGKKKAVQIDITRASNGSIGSEMDLIGDLPGSTYSAVMPLSGSRSLSLNPAQAKLMIAAAGEFRRDSGLQLPRGSIIDNGFGFVKRSSIVSATGTSKIQARRMSSVRDSLKDKRASVAVIDSEDGGKQPIPTGMLRYPLTDEAFVAGVSKKDAQAGTTSSLALPGFLLMCPFPGFDPEKLDKASLSVSAIYSKPLEKDAKAETDTDPGRVILRALERRDPIPEGFTSERNPVLWPNKNQSVSLLVLIMYNTN